MEKKPIAELQVDGIDIKGALARMGNNKKIYQKVLGKFIDTTTFADLKDALADENLEKAKKAAHDLKGVGGNIGLTELMEASAKVDLLLKKDMIAQDAEEMRELEKAYVKAIEGIKNILEYGV